MRAWLWTVPPRALALALALVLAALGATGPHLGLGSFMLGQATHGAALGRGVCRGKSPRAHHLPRVRQQLTHQGSPCPAVEVVMEGAVALA